jgi:hypothetical protein
MPRARKTQSGAQAMTTQQVPGQQYGKGVEQVALQNAMPAPQAPSVASPLPQRGPQPGSPTPAAGAVPPTAPSAASAPIDPMAAFAALKDKVGVLNGSTTRPMEPVTAGLSTGPGAGPEVLGLAKGSPLGDTLRRLSSELGDPMFAELARKARL